MNEFIKRASDQSTNEGIMDKQANEEYSGMSMRDKEIQSSIWALILLVAEMALSFRILRDRLQARNALTLEDEQIIDQAVGDEEALRMAYNHIEKAFRAKFDRCIFAMDNPQEVERIVKEKMESQKQAQDFKSTAGSEVIDLGAIEDESTRGAATKEKKPKFIDLSQGEK